MDTQGSIRASLKGAKPTFRSQNIEPALLATAKQFLESFQFDLRIRRLLAPDKMEQSIGKYAFHCIGNEQRYEPGYIVVMKGHPVLFIHGRLQFGVSLRLRLHASIYQKEAIFIGTLDTIHATLRLEDALYYDGKNLTRDTYTKRFTTLRHFYENAFVQDLRLSGLHVELVKPSSLSQLKDMVDSGNYHSIDLIPEQGGRGRFHIPLTSGHTVARSEKPQQKQTQTQTQLKEVSSSSQSPVLTSISAPVIFNTSYTTAYAHKITGLPDTYDLRNEQGESIGKAAVQTAKLSIALRQAFSKPQTKDVKVDIEWHEDFQRYKIQGIHEEK